MKILVSAFAFAPNQGSEPGVGWRWAVELAKQHQVVVVTDTTRQHLVEAAGVELPPNLQVMYFRPKWLANVPLNSRTAQLLYTLWQFGLLGFAKRLHAHHHFDLAMHVTYSVFRHPSFLGYLGIPFIFGPVGGGEDAPWRLKRSIKGREKLKEMLRTMINAVASIDPMLWVAYAKATLILVSTQDTKKALPFPFRQRAIVYPNLGIDAPLSNEVRCRDTAEPLRVLFVGRLLGWKGAHLAIRAFARAREQGLDVAFTLVGSGPFGAELHRLANRLGVETQIQWIASVPHEDMPALMREHHGFLFPSLHDSGGTVVLEAQANGLPVVCLDLGGPASLVTSTSALVIGTDGLDEAEVVEALFEALVTLCNDEPHRRAMSASAILHIKKTMNWESRVTGALALLKESGHVR
jgi:glycosyltransferase involved in cell wall biosynthesis